MLNFVVVPQILIVFTVVAHVVPYIAFRIERFVFPTVRRKCHVFAWLDISYNL